MNRSTDLASLGSSGRLCILRRNRYIDPFDLRHALREEIDRRRAFRLYLVDRFRDAFLLGHGWRWRHHRHAGRCAGV